MSWIQTAEPAVQAATVWLRARPSWLWWLLGVVALVLSLVLSLVWWQRVQNQALQHQYDKGYSAGMSECNRLRSQATTAALGQQAQKTQADTNAAAADGVAQTARSARVAGTFTQLRRELDALHARTTAMSNVALHGGLHAPTDPTPTTAGADAAGGADVCVLPAERLRIWQAANAGGARGADAGGGAAARQPADRAAAAAPAAQRDAEGAGAKPLERGGAVPPTGDTNLRPAAAPAAGAPERDQPAGLRAVAEVAARRDLWPLDL